MRGRKILIVEDDPSTLRGLALNLAIEGYDVRTATDGEAGLALARAEHPDLLLADVVLPKLGGLELIRMLHATDPGLRVVILSANAQDVDRRVGLAIGADDYIVKPFSLRELLAHIDAALGQPAPGSEELDVDASAPRSDEPRRAGARYEATATGPSARRRRR